MRPMILVDGCHTHSPPPVTKYHTSRSSGCSGCSVTERNCSGIDGKCCPRLDSNEMRFSLLGCVFLPFSPPGRLEQCTMAIHAGK